MIYCKLPLTTKISQVSPSTKVSPSSLPTTSASWTTTWTYVTTTTKTTSPTLWWPWRTSAMADGRRGASGPLSSCCATTRTGCTPTASSYTCTTSASTVRWFRNTCIDCIIAWKYADTIYLYHVFSLQVSIRNAKMILCLNDFSNRS